MIKKIVLFVCLVMMIGCNINDNRPADYLNKFKTSYNVYYYNHIKYYEIYTDSEVIVCSFNGTNYLLEKGKEEEILSTTAPIEITSITKFNENGEEYEWK